MAEPSAEAIAEADEFILDELYRAFGLIESYARSGFEAARRGDRDEIRFAFEFSFAIASDTRLNSTICCPRSASTRGP